MADTDNFAFSGGTWVAWVFIFLIVLGVGALVVSKGEHTENRNRTNDTYKASCDAEKQALRDALNQNQLITSQATQTRDAIAAQTAQLNANAFNALQMKYFENLMAQNNVIGGLNTKIAVDQSNAQLNGVLCTKANAPVVSALGCSPCVVNPNNFGGCTGTL